MVILIARCLALPWFSGFNHYACLINPALSRVTYFYLKLHTAYPCHRPRYRLTMNFVWTNKDRSNLFISIYISVFIFFVGGHTSLSRDRNNNDSRSSQQGSAWSQSFAGKHGRLHLKGYSQVMAKILDNASIVKLTINTSFDVSG